MLHNTMNEPRIKHLEMIQAVINRLAGNSFMLKSWSITVVSALIALAAKDTNERYALLALFPALCFWGLDAYYLRQERLFRALHDMISRHFGSTEHEQSVPLFSLNTAPVACTVNGWAKVLVSWTIVGVHGPIIALVLVVITVFAKIR